MSEFPQNLTESGFQIKGELSNGNFSAVLEGAVDVENPAAQLKPYLDALHEAAAAKQVAEVVLDFRPLTFMNSSGIKQFVAFILKDAQTGADKQYKIRVLYDQGVTWQASSLPILKKLQPGLVVMD